MGILVVSRETELLVGALQEAGVRTRAVLAADLPSALEQLEKQTWELVLIDAGLAGGAGLELIEPLTASGQAVVVVSSEPTLSLTLRALRAGARDVLALPPSPVRLRQLSEEATGSASPVVAAGMPTSSWVGSSPALLDAFRGAVRLSPETAPVLIRGEMGTGKELLARLIHEQGPRSAGPFVAMNCGALSESVLDAELFGRERSPVVGVRGRRVGRAVKADGGTLLLSEVTRLTVRQQWAVLRLVDHGEVEPAGATEAVPVDVRVVATVDESPPSQENTAGLIPELYYRFTAGTLHLPALRERGDADIRALAEHFVAQYAARYEREPPAIGEDAWLVLTRHTWPGNVRQLRGALERAVVESAGGTIHATDLPFELRRSVERQPSALGMTLDDLEKRHIVRTLEMTEGHLARTAELLGIHRNTLRRKLLTYGIDAD